MSYSYWRTLAKIRKLRKYISYWQPSNTGYMLSEFGGHGSVVISPDEPIHTCYATSRMYINIAALHNSHPLQVFVYKHGFFILLGHDNYSPGFYINTEYDTNVLLNTSNNQIMNDVLHVRE